MSKLISSKEAKLAWANGEGVEFKIEDHTFWYKWTNIKDKDGGFLITDFDIDDIQFRLKPSTITINGIKVPAPFNPKDGEEFYNLQPCNESGWMGDILGYKKGYCDNWIQFGAWRTEEEIRQVVAALREVFK